MIALPIPFPRYSWRTTTLDPIDAPGGITQDFRIFAHFVSTVDPCDNHCSNGKQDCGETGIDCGGGCYPCGCGDQTGTETVTSSCESTTYNELLGSYEDCYNACSARGCSATCDAQDVGWGIACTCTINKDYEICGTLTCPSDCCSGIKLYNYRDTPIDMWCIGGSCVPYSTCTPRISSCGDGPCNSPCETQSNCCEDCGGCAPVCTPSCESTCTRTTSTSCIGTRTCTASDCSQYPDSCNMPAGTGCGTLQTGNCILPAGECGAGTRTITTYSCNGYGSCTPSYSSQS